MNTEFFGAKPDSMRACVTVSELNRMVSSLIERSLPMVGVSGELSNVVRAASGHMYFSLKDASAQVRAVMFRGRAQSLSFVPKEGLKVEVYASASLYQARGDFQLQVESMRLAGAGDLNQQFLQLKAKLQAEGLFDEAAKRSIPRRPRAIAVVCSPQAAALRDVLITLSKRAPWLQVYLFPSLVQGAQAAGQLLQALAKANQFAVSLRTIRQAAPSLDDEASSGGLTNETASLAPEVILLVRGGGSIEDLWAFNDEALARAIRQSALPVISGVGHESDVTIADFAADLRAATPTAAAVAASPDREQDAQALQGIAWQLARNMRQRLDSAEQNLDLAMRGLRSPAQALRLQTEKAQSLSLRLLAQGRSLSAGTVLTQNLAQRLKQALEPHLLAKLARVESLNEQIKLVSPQAVLDRGYAILSQDKIIRSPQDIDPSRSIDAQLARGKVKLRAQS